MPQFRYIVKTQFVHSSVAVRICALRAMGPSWGLHRGLQTAGRMINPSATSRPSGIIEARCCAIAAGMEEMMTAVSWRSCHGETFVYKLTKSGDGMPGSRQKVRRCVPRDSEGHRVTIKHSSAVGHRVSAWSVQ